MTYSFGRICFAVGAPSVTVATYDSSDAHGMTKAAEWECGCESTGPRQAMRWDPCDDHVRFAATLNEVTSAYAVSQHREAEYA